MVNIKLLVKQAETLPPVYQAELLDFAGYLAQKAAKNIAEHGCPLDHVPNAVTIAAFDEGDAIRRGEIQTEKFSSLEDFFADLESC
jgi:hypothetical protein